MKLTEQQKNRVAVVLMGTGAAFMALGVFRDEVGTVFLKAVQICMECIGIG